VGGVANLRRPSPATARAGSRWLWHRSEREGSIRFLPPRPAPSCCRWRKPRRMFVLVQ